MHAPPTTYRLVSADRLRMLMERTGTGARLTTRGLADQIGVSLGVIGNMLGQRAAQPVPEDRARAIADAIGVDLLVIWEPVSTRRTGAEAAMEGAAA